MIYKPDLLKYVRNYRFSQKLKLLGNDEFNHLTNILTLLLTCGLRPPLPLMIGAQHVGFLIF